MKLGIRHGFIKNAYGEVLSKDCLEDCLPADRSNVEYFIKIATGEEDIKFFDADFLCTILKSWRDNKHLIALSKEELEKLEETFLCLVTL